MGLWGLTLSLGGPLEVTVGVGAEVVDDGDEGGGL